MLDRDAGKSGGLAGQANDAAIGVAGSDERDLADAYASIRPTAYGTFVLMLCIFVGMVEGYDVQAMSLAAPLLARAWELSPPMVGLLLSASLIGQSVGGFLLAPLGDRIGRRTSLLAGLAIAGSATYAGAFMPNFDAMMASRFVAGLGLGFALANTITLAMELVPSNWRSISVVLVSSGYPLGAAAGAAIVGNLLPTYGVAAVFYVGGIGTLAAFVLGLAMIPESPVMLLRRSADQGRLRRVLARLGVAIDPDVRLVSHADHGPKSKVAALFTPERRSTTLLLWLLNFSNLSLVFFFVMWLPSLFVASGLEPGAAIKAMSLFSFAGIIGGLTLATLLPRVGVVYTLGSCYLAALVVLASFASTSASSQMFLVLLACCGFLITGTQFCLHAVVNLFYPGPIRATGLGFALGAGRVGGILAPIIGGYVLAHAASPSHAFYVALIPTAVSLIALLMLRRFQLVGLHSE